MPDTPPTPAPDSLAAEALRRGKRLRRRRLLVHRGATSAALLGVVAVAVVLKVAVSPSPHAGAADPGTSTTAPGSPTTSASTTTSTISPPNSTTPTTTITPPTTTSTSTTTSTTTTVPPTTVAQSGTTSGTVTGPGGQPVGGAYVIGLDNLAVAVTDANGDYSMPCVSQPLVAASWLIPIDSPSPGTSGGYAYGTDTTSYGAPPTSSGPGYVFSGGASDISTASTVTCDGQPVDFQLPQGGAVDITWSGSAKGTTPPIDNLYLPGLGHQAALETAPVSSSGQQVIDQIGPGTLQIDEVSTPFSCTGPGTTADGQAIFSVTVTAGQTTSVTCTIGTASS
jgi:hypothetical protein